MKNIKTYSNNSVYSNAEISFKEDSAVPEGVLPAPTDLYRFPEGPLA